MKLRFVLALALLTVAPGGAMAASQEEQNACMNDAFNVCGNAIPDRDKVAACLAANLNRISSACRTVMLRYQKPSKSRMTGHDARDAYASGR